MLDVIGVDFDYQDHALLSKISFSLAKGGLLHIQGANGAGKTTLLQLLAGLYRPHQGHICYKGYNIQDHLSDYHQDLCYVGHKIGINPTLTLKENCLYDVHYKKHIDPIALAAVFNLTAHLDSLCAHLSMGQKRQAGLLRLWMSEAPLWLLDEPLVALDEQALSILMNKIHEHRAQGGMIVLTSHQPLPLDKNDYQEFRL